MKKITLIVFAIICSINLFGQANILVKAPPGSNATTQVRAPNGNSSHTTMRGCFLVTANELTPYMLPGTIISSFGFTLSAGVTGTACTGNFTVYLENTSDVSYNKGLSFSTAIAPMNLAYNGNMTIPISAGTTSISVNLSTPFTYTGGGIYVAYDWASSGPFSPTVATYQADNTLASGGASNSTSVSPASDVLGATAFRPVFLWGAANTATNDAQVLAIEALGSVAGVFNTPNTIKAIVKNGSNASMSNIPVSLNVTGANTFANTLTVVTLAAGAQTTVNFAGFNPQNNGINTISVTVPSDQLNGNNSQSYSQTVTCNVMGQNPQPGSYTTGVGFATNSGIIGARLVPPVTTTCMGARIGISTDANTNGKSVWAVLMSSTGGILATSNTVTLNASIMGTLHDFTFGTPVNVAAGTTYIVGLAQPATAGGFWPVAAAASNYIPAGLYVTTFTTGGAPGTVTQNLGFMSLQARFANTATLSATSASNSVCSGYSVTLNAAGANTYTWSTGSTNAIAIATPTAAVETYTVEGVTLAGCTASAAVSVSTTPSPTITASASGSVICPALTTTLTASGADTYSWTSLGTGSTMVVNPLNTTTYVVMGTSTLSNCSATTAVMVTVDAATISITSPTAICIGTAAALSANGGITYTWSTGSTFSAVAVSPSVTTIYTVTGVNATGCAGSASVQIQVNSNPSLSVTAYPSATVCAGKSYTLGMGGAANYTAYSWAGTVTINSSSTSSDAVVYTPTATSVYTVIGSNMVGCAVTKTISVSVESCVGINEQYLNGVGLTIFPNPVSDHCVIRFNTTALRKIRVEDISGRIVKELNVIEQEVRINMESEPPGIYLLSAYERERCTGNIKIVKN